jgi:hypothetical protein
MDRRLPIYHPEHAATVIAVGNDEDFRGLQPTIHKMEPLNRPAPMGSKHITAATNTTAQDVEEEE